MARRCRSSAVLLALAGLLVCAAQAADLQACRDTGICTEEDAEAASANRARRDKLAADIEAGRATVHTGKANKGVAPSGAEAPSSSGLVRKASCAQQDGPDIGVPVVKGAISLQKFNAIKRHNKHEKIIHFVRHAEGHHNVAASPYARGSEGYLRALQNFEHYDARLSPTGEQQCHQLAMETVALEYDLIVVSPLTRTLQTASLGFLPKTQRRIGSGAASTMGGIDGASVPFLAYEPLRERFGRNPCDNRRRVTELQEEFPHVNFSLIESDADPHPCSAEDCGERETDEEIDRRITKFLLFLRDRPEYKIAVVGHSATFARMFEIHLRWHERGGDFRLKNAEVRSLVLAFDSRAREDGLVTRGM